MQAIAKVSKSAIINNYTYFKKIQGKNTIIPVVKADAYGHGAIEVARILIESFKLSTFAVATLEEAEMLSDQFPIIDILIFSKIFKAELPRIRRNFIISIISLDDFNLVQSWNHTYNLRCHINFNTGMNRLGLKYDAFLAVELLIDNQIMIEGIYSHYATSDEVDTRYYLHQQNEFRKIALHFLKNGFDGLIHISNSASGIRETCKYSNALRLGIGLYGYDMNIHNGLRPNLKQVLSLEAPVVAVFQVKKNESVSYGQKWFATEVTTIATLRIGYADGFSRLLSSKAKAMFKGDIFDIVGTITMDHVMVDIKTANIKVGDYFTLYGTSHEDISIYTISEKLKTIPYEITCAISSRVKRMVVE